MDYEELTRRFFRETLEHVPSAAAYVAVVDGVQIPRHSHKMPETSWLKHPKTPPFSPGPHRAQRFLHLAALLPQSQEVYTRALPLRWEPAFSEPYGRVRTSRLWPAGSLKYTHWPPLFVLKAPEVDFWGSGQCSSPASSMRP